MTANYAAECTTCGWEVYSSSRDFIATAVDNHIESNTDHVITMDQEEK